MRREAHHVERVGEQRQVGDRVLDLGALVELGPTDHLVGDLAAHERVLDHPRHRVRAVQDRDLRARGALVEETLDLADDEPRLGVLVVERARRGRRPLPQLAPQPLGDAAAIVGDHRVGRRQDRLGRAVVLLELHHAGIGEVLLEVEDVAHVGSAEAVDRLAVVAHHRQVAMARDARTLVPARAPGARLRRAAGAAGTARSWCPGTRRRARGGTSRSSARAPPETAPAG